MELLVGVIRDATTKSKEINTDSRSRMLSCEEYTVTVGQIFRGKIQHDDERNILKLLVSWDPTVNVSDYNHEASPMPQNSSQELSISKD
eukprot:768351-Hanusia_phi.AAC.3